MELTMKSKLTVIVLWFCFGLFSCFIANAQISDVPSKPTITEKNQSQKFKNNHDFAYMPVIDSLLRNKQRVKKFESESDSLVMRNIKTRETSAIDTFFNNNGIRRFFQILAVLFIAFIIYRLFLKNTVFTRRKASYTSIENENTEVVLEEREKYDSLIHEAEQNDNYNLAIKYFYLKSLKILSDRGFIRFSPDKTNVEYVKEMRQNRPDLLFKNLTRNYEYAWYGQFAITPRSYQNIKSEFVNFIKKA